MSTADRNYTDIEQSGIGSKVERAGDITGEPLTNEDTVRNKAAEMANLLEGLEFPTTKEKIRNHLNAASPSMSNRINDVVEAIENSLDDYREYGSAYDVEVAVGLVRNRDKSQRLHANDSGPNTINRKRQDTYGRRERISGASAKDVSPNTPKGEDV
ncbi:MAG TPA: hypothetical protein VJ695_09420 [Nitrososphaera sp.]|nr:hypothetical protein [Nitrososphaera sp.]